MASGQIGLDRERVRRLEPGANGTLIPSGWTRDARGTFAPSPRARIGVYQALSSRNGGEVISADSY
jgi:hypothetical protein